jgi:hypothetical protein
VYQETPRWLIGDGIASQIGLKIAYLLAPVLCFCALAQNRDEENSKLEITGSFWAINSSGTIRANGTPVDLKSDLGVSQNQPTFTGKLVVKPGRKHNIVIEGTPFRLSGTNDLTRTITYSGKTYTLSDRVTSLADLDYFYAGYQYDLISRPAGHFGLMAGGAYLSADGTIRSQVSGLTASKTETIGLPLAGAGFRVFPVRRRVLLVVDGEVKGMDVGSYGHYVQASASAGIGVGPVLIEGGYRVVNFDLHTTNKVTAVSPQFKGPLLSIVFRLR